MSAYAKLWRYRSESKLNVNVDQYHSPKCLCGLTVWAAENRSTAFGRVWTGELATKKKFTRLWGAIDSYRLQTPTAETNIIEGFYEKQLRETTRWHTYHSLHAWWPFSMRCYTYKVSGEQKYIYCEKYWIFFLSKTTFIQKNNSII